MNSSPKIFILIIIPIQSLVFSCRKEKNFLDEDLARVAEDDLFFERNNGLKGYFNYINSGESGEGFINKMIEQFRILDLGIGFSSGVKAKYGYPNWDLSIVLKNDNKLKTLVTPFVNGDSITALLFSYQIDPLRTNYKIYNKINDYLFPESGDKEGKTFSRESLESLFIVAKKSLDFSKTRNDFTLFNQNSRTVINWMCWNYYATYTTSGGQVTAWATTPQCTYTITYVPDDSENYNEYLEHDQGGGGGTIENWTYTSAVSPNQHIIDSLQGYPCAQDILANLPGCNNEIDSILICVFGINEDVNLKFKPNLVLTKDSLDGYTTFPGGSASFYDQTIQLNPWVLQYSTKEYIAAVIIHESIHAVIDYWRNQYLTHQIDSNQFKSMFPIFWDGYRIRSDGELAQHNEMANSYIDIFKRYLKVLTPNINEDMANALAWGGLHKTTSWAARSDTLQILHYNRLARRDGADTTSFQNYNLNKCD